MCYRGYTLATPSQEVKSQKSKVEGGRDPEDNFEVTTESGRALQLKGKELVLAGFGTKMNHNDDSNNRQYPDYSSLENNIFSRSHRFFARFASQIAAAIPTIPAVKFDVKTTQDLISVNWGRIGIDRIQPAARLTHNPDNINNTSASLNRNKNFLTENSISYRFIKVKDLTVDNYIEGEKIVSIGVVPLSSAFDDDWENVRIDQINIGDPESPTVQSDSGLGQNDEVLNNPLFKDLSDKVSLLEQRINELADTSFSASASALLSEIQQTSMEGIGEVGGMDVEELKNATVSGTLAVLGRATLSDLGVTGNINAGLLSIRGLDTFPCHSRESGNPILDQVEDDKNQVEDDKECTGATINTLSGNLYLQNQGLGGIDILNGKIVIDTKGDIEVMGTITAQGIEAEEFVVKGKDSIGTATIAKGAKEIEISTPAATSTSKIFLTLTTSIPSPLAIVAKSDGKFKVAIADPQPTPVTFDWSVVGSKQ